MRGTCLERRFIESGGVYKLAFGPKAFVVVSDPVVVRHLLKVSPKDALPGNLLIVILQDSLCAA